MTATEILPYMNGERFNPDHLDKSMELAAFKSVQLVIMEQPFAPRNISAAAKEQLFDETYYHVMYGYLAGRVVLGTYFSPILYTRDLEREGPVFAGRLMESLLTYVDYLVDQAGTVCRGGAQLLRTIRSDLGSLS